MANTYDLTVVIRIVGCEMDLQLKDAKASLAMRWLEFVFTMHDVVEVFMVDNARGITFCMADLLGVPCSWYYSNDIPF